MEDGEKMKVGKQRGDRVYSEIKEKRGAHIIKKTRMTDCHDNCNKTNGRQATDSRDGRNQRRRAGGGAVLQKMRRR